MQNRKETQRINSQGPQRNGCHVDFRLFDPTNLTPDKLAQFQQAQDGLSSALSRLLVVVEKYPDLKANENFLQLQAQLEGTENRITVARNRFNETAQSYNTSVRKFPGSLIAGMFGFERKGYFEAAQGAETAPTVDFSNK